MNSCNIDFSFMKCFSYCSPFSVEVLANSSTIPGNLGYSRRRICILEAKRAWYTVGRNSKKRNAAPEPESDSDGSQFNFDNAIEDKPMGKSLDATLC
uniref:Uncharacterized protein n=2 Tax=Caenorhabditis japonica TaxID=281687 RepID=A0A8R1IM25_CAEJA